MDESVKQYGEELKAIIQKSYDSFEKQLNYISAGALGLSMLFVEKAVRDLSNTGNKWLLVVSPYSFFVDVMLSIIVILLKQNYYLPTKSAASSIQSEKLS